MRTINYKGHKITEIWKGRFECHTSRYGIIYSNSLRDIKRLIDTSIDLN